jgi:hypothetical protein
MTSEIFFSYIIPTIGRASLETAVKSVLDQKFSHAEFEVVVVNDSGTPLPQADWQDSPRVASSTRTNPNAVLPATAEPRSQRKISRLPRRRRLDPA